MQYRPLGKTGLEVSVIGLGLAPMMCLEVEAGVPLIRRALELGITYLDTARSYGETEVMIGRALEGRREEVVLSTKTGAKTREEAWTSIRESLERLRTDYVDNCHLHGLRGEEDIEARLGPGGALEALIEARERGLVRHIGCTAHTSRTLLMALERFDFETILVPMNLVEREPLERLIPLCHERGVGVTIMKPVATGLLPARLALKWLLNQPIATIVPGAVTLEELELDAAVGNLEDYTLSAEEEAEVEALRARWEHARCRICAACEPCPQGISIGIVLGTDLMYDHYRNLGRERFAAMPWTRERLERELQTKEELLAKIPGCASCRACEPRCPYGLPIVEMLQGLVPALQDMVALCREKLGTR
jgi:aryl-alcohol dehydrogenase-like predicted oxidoreductase